MFPSRISQENLFVKIEGPGFDDAVVVTAIIRERISTMFEFDIRLQSEKVIDTASLVNKEVCICIKELEPSDSAGGSSGSDSGDSSSNGSSFAAGEDDSGNETDSKNGDAAEDSASGKGGKKHSLELTDEEKEYYYRFFQKNDPQAQDEFYKDLIDDEIRYLHDIFEYKRRRKKDEKLETKYKNIGSNEFEDQEFRDEEYWRFKSRSLEDDEYIGKEPLDLYDKELSYLRPIFIPLEQEDREKVLEKEFTQQQKFDLHIVFEYRKTGGGGRSSRSNEGNKEEEKEKYSSRVSEQEQQQAGSSSQDASSSDSASSKEEEKIERYFAGIVAEASIENMPAVHPEAKAAGNVLHLKVVPSIFRLSLTKKYRIFQEMSAVDIIEKVLKDGGISNIKKNVSSAGQKQRIFCVQYYESDLDFISRLMEEEGIFYHFLHEKNKDTFCFADDSTSSAQKVDPVLKVRRTRSHPDLYLDDVYNISTGESLALKKIMSISYNDDKFEVVSGQAEDSGAAYNIGDIEIYNNPFEDASSGNDISKTLLESGNTESKFMTGNSQSINLYSGALCTISESVIDSQNGDFLVVELEHTITQFNYSDEEEPLFYQNKFKLIPSDVNFRPPLLHHKNRIYGTQTAVVTGASGEEIFCDEKGRIKVRFHWDTTCEDEEKSSCWIRVAQVWAGKSFGGLIIPRVGMEVLVSFVNGDPDQPLITGCIYNGVNVSPGDYPKDKNTASTFYTNSSKDGGGFNELRFDDLKDEEEIFLHGQKDMNIIIEHTVTETINTGDKIMLMKSDDGKIKRDLTIVEGDHIITINKGDMTVTLEEGSQTITLNKGDQTVTLDKGNQSITLSSGNQTVTLGGGNMTIDVTGDISISATGKLTIDVKDDISIKSAKNIACESSMDTKVKAGMNIKMEATLNSEEKGLMIKREAKTIIQDKGSAAVQIDGGGAAVIKGGMVQIN